MWIAGVLGAIGFALGWVIGELRRKEAFLKLKLNQGKLDAFETQQQALKEAEGEVIRLRAEERAWEQKLVLLKEAQESLSQQFKALSSDALQKNNQIFVDLAKATFEKYQEGAKGEFEKKSKTISELLTPVKETLSKLDEGLVKIEKERKSDQATIKTQVDMLIRTEKELKTETSSLVKALRAPITRGRWGEVQLKRVVELAGMVNHCDFFEQETMDSGRLRPDLIVRLPGGRQVVIDSKVPLESYLESIDAPEQLKEEKLKGHARQVRMHVQQLSKKSYFESIQPSPEFVVLFLPSEPFFSAALEYDPTLIEVGAEQGVILATPTTLIALLRSVAYGWKQENLSRHAEKVSALGHDLYKRIVDMSQHFTKMGRGLNSAIDAYNKGVGSLEARVLPTARKFQELGAATSSLELEPLEVIEKSPRLLQSSELRKVEVD